MKIRLVDVDSKIPNLALMKLSSYHKAKGNDVDWYTPVLDHKDTDIVYASKVFNYTPDYPWLPNCEIIQGGPGYNSVQLPLKINHVKPDYSLYQIDYAMGYTSRGCNRKCEFCIIPGREGKLKATNDIYEFWKGQKSLMLLDNNLTGSLEQFYKILNQIIKEKIKVDICQGLDIRLIDKEKAELLKKVKFWKSLKFAFDNISMENLVVSGIQDLLKAGFHPNKLMFYVLIGFNTTEKEDLHRINLLKKLGVNPYIMIYSNGKRTRYQIDLARYVNRKQIFESISWEEYSFKFRRKK